jgi:hypothetical protein
MNLTAEQFKALVGSLSVDLSSSCTENRRAARAKSPGWALITVCSNEAAEKSGQERVHVSNISSRGIGVAHTRPMGPGQQFVIHMSKQAGSQIHILCTVVHCTAKAGGMHAVGAEFTCTIGPEELQARLGEAGAGARIQESVLK